MFIRRNCACFAAGRRTAAKVVKTNYARHECGRSVSVYTVGYGCRIARRLPGGFVLGVALHQGDTKR